MKRISSILALSLLAISNGTLCLAADAQYHLIKEIPVPGKAQWDYLRIDPEAHRLYLSHGTQVEVIDVDKGTVIGTISDTPGVHGMAIVSKLGRVFISNGQENTASIVDIKTLKTISKVSTGANPDSILYEPTQNEVYTFNGKGKSATVFNPESGKVITTIDLGGKPESPPPMARRAASMSISRTRARSPSLTSKLTRSSIVGRSPRAKPLPA